MGVVRSYFLFYLLFSCIKLGCLLCERIADVALLAFLHATTPAPSYVDLSANDTPLSGAVVEYEVPYLRARGIQTARGTVR